MPTFDDLTRYLDDTLTLPINGVQYVIPSVTAQDGLWAQQMMNLALEAQFEAEAAANRDPDKPAPHREPRQAPVIDDADEREFFERMLSKPVLDQMLADKVSWAHVKRAAEVAFLWATADLDAALARWEDDGQGKAPTSRQGSRQAARSPKKAGRSGSRTSHKAGKKAASRGGGSSSAGR